MERNNIYNELITVIIPAYNAEKYIERAIESVKKQTYTNLEIIIIDDGSKDRTGEIAERLEKEDRRIKVLHVENGGEAKSRNLGLEKAKGKYIAFCDADDYMHPKMLEKMYDAICKDDSDMAICSWKNVNENGQELPWKAPQFRTCKMSSQEAQIQFLTTGNVEGFCWNKLFKKELYEKTGIKYDIKRLSYCDILANYCLIKASESVSYVDEKLYDYYQLETTCTHTSNIKKDYDYVDTLEEVYREAVNAGLEKQGELYKIYRLFKYLYAMYQKKEEYENKVFQNFFITIYKNDLNQSMLKNLYLSMKCSLESPIKYIYKVCSVILVYKRVKNG